MSLDDTDDRTHEVLSEELHEYNREAVDAEVEQALAESPAPAADPDTDIDATFELFEDETGSWRWRLVEDDGEILAISTRVYSNRQAAQQSVGEIKQAMDTAGIVPA